MQVKIIGVIAIHLTLLVLGQDYYPGKDAAFGQVAVGGGIETVINLTNRGTYPYAGSIRFLRGQGSAWNLRVNGSVISNGEYSLEIQPKSTASIRLTGDRLESGAAVVVSQDLLLDNFIEANLTYFVRSGESVADSVGISPSKEFYLASVPFQDLNSIALALVNGDLSGQRVARVLLRLFTEGGSQLATKTLELGSFSTMPAFCRNSFQGSTCSGGRSKSLPISQSSERPSLWKKGRFRAYRWSRRRFPIRFG